MMTIAVYLIAAYPTREFDSGSLIGSCWSVNWSAPPLSFSHNADLGTTYRLGRDRTEGPRIQLRGPPHVEDAGRRNGDRKPPARAPTFRTR
jgi:hypothetical protein